MIVQAFFDVDTQSSWIKIDEDYIQTTPRGNWVRIECGDIDKLAFVECMTVENIHTSRYLAKEYTKKHCTTYRELYGILNNIHLLSDSFRTPHLSCRNSIQVKILLEFCTKWVFEFIDACQNQEKIMKYARAIKRNSSSS